MTQKWAQCCWSWQSMGSWSGCPPSRTYAPSPFLQVLPCSVHLLCHLAVHWHSADGRPCNCCASCDAGLCTAHDQVLCPCVVALSLTLEATCPSHNCMSQGCYMAQGNGTDHHGSASCSRHHAQGRQLMQRLCSKLLHS